MTPEEYNRIAIDTGAILGGDVNLLLEGHGELRFSEVVMEFQAKHSHLRADGMLGPLTLEVLRRVVDSGYVWPLSGDPVSPVITSDYWTRNSQRNGDIRNKHCGIDLMYPYIGDGMEDRAGYPLSVYKKRWWIPNDCREVLAVADGHISRVKDLDNGWAVAVRHDNEYESLYLHLENPGAPPLKRQVKKGEQIARISFDKDDVWPFHLHFAVLKNGLYCDPVEFLEGKGATFVS